MEQPLQITFRRLEPSDAVKASVTGRAQNLERFYDKIETCRVLVESHNSPSKGSGYHVRIRLTVPGQELIVSRDPERRGPKEDLDLTIQNAFREMKRELQDYVGRRRRQVKAHE